MTIMHTLYQGLQCISRYKRHNTFQQSPSSDSLLRKRSHIFDLHINPSGFLFVKVLRNFSGSDILLFWLLPDTFSLKTQLNHCHFLLCWPSQWGINFNLFIEDIGRLSLKHHFGGFTEEGWIDRAHGMMGEMEPSLRKDSLQRKLRMSPLKLLTLIFALFLWVRIVGVTSYQLVLATFFGSGHKRKRHDDTWLWHWWDIETSLPIKLILESLFVVLSSGI